MRTVFGVFLSTVLVADIGMIYATTDLWAVRVPVTVATGAMVYFMPKAVDFYSTGIGKGISRLLGRCAN